MHSVASLLTCSCAVSCATRTVTTVCKCEHSGQEALADPAAGGATSPWPWPRTAWTRLGLNEVFLPTAGRQDGRSAPACSKARPQGCGKAGPHPAATLCLPPQDSEQLPGTAEDQPGAGGQAVPHGKGHPPPLPVQHCLLGPVTQSTSGKWPLASPGSVRSGVPDLAS